MSWADVGRALAAADRVSRHEISERVSPIDVVARCSCGWSHSETRRQNALARAAKMRAAIRRHLEEKAKVS